MATRNITLSLPEDLVRRAKVLAAQRDTSVSALVGELLSQLAGTTPDFDLAWAEEEVLMEKASASRSARSPGAATNCTSDEP